MKMTTSHRACLRKTKSDRHVPTWHRSFSFCQQFDISLLVYSLGSGSVNSEILGFTTVCCLLVVKRKIKRGRHLILCRTTLSCIGLAFYLHVWFLILGRNSPMHLMLRPVQTSSIYRKVYIKQSRNAFGAIISRYMVSCLPAA